MKKEEFKKQYRELYDDPQPLLKPYPPRVMTVVGSFQTGLRFIQDPQKAMVWIRNCETEEEFKSTFGKLSYNVLARRPEIIMQAVEKFPRAFLLYKEINIEPNMRTIEDGMKRNSRIFELLTDKQRQDMKIVDLYREENLKRGLQTCSLIDPQTYYSTSAYKECYERLLMNSHAAHSTKDCPYVLKDINESPLKRFMDEAEKVNPELARGYAQQKKEVLEKNVHMVAYIMTRGSNYFKDAYLYWANEAMANCPKQTEIAVSDFRNKIWDELSKTDFSDHKNPEFAKWLQQELDEHKEKYRQGMEPTAKQQERLTKELEESPRVKADELIEFLEQNKDAVVAAIAEGRISINDIAEVLGQKYDVGVPLKEKRTNNLDSGDVKIIAEAKNIDEQGNDEYNHDNRQY